MYLYVIILSLLSRDRKCTLDNAAKIVEIRRLCFLGRRLREFLEISKEKEETGFKSGAPTRIR